MIKYFTEPIKYNIDIFKAFSYLNLNNEIINKVIYDVKRLSFKSHLYNKIIKDLILNNYIEYNGNINDDFLYLKILKNKLSMNKFNSYIDNMFNFILSKNKNILYIDTDVIFYTGDINIEGIDNFLEYDIDDIYCIKISRKKNIAFIINNEIIYRSNLIKENTLIELKSILREKKLKNILN